MSFNFCCPKNLVDLKSETLSSGGRFYLLPSGKKVPSVTTVMGAMKKDAILAWRKRVGEEEANKISRKASSRGTNVHSLCEAYIKGEIISSGDNMPDALEMFYSIKNEIDSVNNIHYMEQSLWSEQLGLAGRVDLIAEYKGTLSVIDFKTSKKIKSSEEIEDYFWQTCAYALMYEELVGSPIDQLVIIMAVENEKPLIFIEETEKHITGLLHAIRKYHI